MIWKLDLEELLKHHLQGKIETEEITALAEEVKANVVSHLTEEIGKLFA